MSHNFRTGSWAKKKQTGRDHANFLMNSTNAQRAFIHEICHQALGGTPSDFWGQQPVPQEVMIPADKQTLKYTMLAARHPAHEFGRLISSHKKASGFISGIGEIIGDLAKTAGKYGKNAMSFIAKNHEAIKSGVAIGKDLFQTGTTVAQLAGWIPEGKKTQLDAIANALAKHASGDHYAAKKPEKPDKKGGSFRRIMV